LEFGAVNESLWDNERDLDDEGHLHKGVKALEAEFPWIAMLGRKTRTGN